MKSQFNFGQLFKAGVWLLKSCFMKSSSNPGLGLIHQQLFDPNYRTIAHGETTDFECSWAASGTIFFFFFSTLNKLSKPTKLVLTSQKERRNKANLDELSPIKMKMQLKKNKQSRGFSNSTMSLNNIQPKTLENSTSQNQ